MADLTNRNADETVPDIATWGSGNVLETGEGTVKVDLDDKASLSFVNDKTPRSVKEFGAKGDGSTDDTDAIQNAIDFCSDNGFVCFFPEGEYKLLSPILIKTSHVHIEGASKKLSRFIGTPDGGFISFVPDLGEVIEDITIKSIGINAVGFTDSNGLSSIHQNGYIRHQSAGNIKDVLIEDVDMVGDIDSRSMIVFIDRDLVSEGINRRIWFNRVTINSKTNVRAYGIVNRRATADYWVTNCQIRLTTDALNGIGVYGDTVNFFIYGNKVQDCGHSAIAVSPAQRGIIANNIVRDVPFDDNDAEGGIEIEMKDNHEGETPSRDITVTGNYILNCYWGIFVRDSDDEGRICENITISGNVVKNSPDTGIHLMNVKNISVVGNIIDQRGESDGHGIVIEKNVTNATFSDNIIEGCHQGHCVDVRGSLSSERIKFHKNTIIKRGDNSVSVNFGCKGNLWFTANHLDIRHENTTPPSAIKIENSNDIARNFYINDNVITANVSGGVIVKTNNIDKFSISGNQFNRFSTMQGGNNEAIRIEVGATQGNISQNRFEDGYDRCIILTVGGHEGVIINDNNCEGGGYNSREVIRVNVGSSGGIDSKLIIISGNLIQKSDGDGIVSDANESIIQNNIVRNITGTAIINNGSDTLVDNNLTD